MDFQQSLALIKGDLDKVEGAIRGHFQSDVAIIPIIGSYLFYGGGKRVRPVMLLLTSRLCGYKGDSRHIAHSCVVEFLHTATLLHDDVIDASPKRRGNPSANSKWGNEVSVLVGDFLFAKSFDIMAHDEDRKALKILSDTCLRMAEGEVLQQVHTCDLSVSEEGYIDIIKRKTAALISTCCRLGAVLGGASAVEEEALASFGLNVGMAFQLVDDILDYTADEEKLGKPTGTDLREGNVTLPLILLYRKCSPEERSRIEYMMETGDIRPQDVKEVVDLMNCYEIFPKVESRAREYTRKAHDELNLFNNSLPYLQGLKAVANFVVNRDL